MCKSMPCSNVSCFFSGLSMQLLVVLIAGVSGRLLTQFNLVGLYRNWTDLLK